jgi:hypothetical protein
MLGGEAATHTLPAEASHGPTGASRLPPSPPLNREVQSTKTSGQEAVARRGTPPTAGSSELRAAPWPESLPTMKLLRERGPAAAVHRPGLARRPPPAAAGEGLREEEGLVAADLGFP